jgi:hypothetical protein
MGLGELEEKRLRRIPRAGRAHVLRALNDRDPRVRGMVVKALEASNPEEVFAKQAERDIAEAIRPTGRLVVFKDLAVEGAVQARSIEDALMRAVPGQPTAEGAIAQAILTESDDPKGALEEFYNAVALQAVTGASLDQIVEEGDEAVTGFAGLADLGKFKIGKKLKKIWKKVKKPLIIAAAVVGAVIAAPVVLPILGSVVSTVGSAIGAGATAIFGGGRTTQQEQYYQQAETLDTQSQAAQTAGDTVLANQLHQQAEAARQQSTMTEVQMPPMMPGPSYMPTVAPRPGVPAPSVLDNIASAALSVYAIKRMAATSRAPSDIQNYQVQRETLVKEIMVQTNVSRVEAERLADQAISQIEGEKGAASIPGEVTRAGMIPNTGAILPILVIGGILVVAMAKKGR